MTSLYSLTESIPLLLTGQVGVIPTDTVYGLAACASNEQAVTRLYALKHRERKPGTIIAASVEQLIGLGFDEATLRSVSHLWPASLSVVVPLSRKFAYLDQGVGDQALRIPKDKQLLSVLAKTGPLVTSSANDPGEPVAETISEAYDYFHDDVSFYVDGGTLSGRAPSTIIRVRADKTVEVLRAGAVPVTPGQHLTNGQ